ncbi:MAG: hypothetical protein LBI37_00075 [Puniceicoccales bacterium]|jgi:hypothetical protein|nr:hypothetical protein [Puniceicoccales bacterium]
MKNLKIVLVGLCLLLMAELIYLGFKYKTPTNETQRVLLERYTEKKLEAAPITGMALDTMETCLKFLVFQASSKEVEGQKQLLIKQRSMVPMPCQEMFNTFLFFVDEIINEDINALNKNQINDLSEALHSAFNDLITTYVSYLDDQYGHPDLERPKKIDLD